MKILCHREGMLSALQAVSPAAAARDVKPILQNVKASVEDTRCTLMATDLEFGIRLEVRGIKVEEPGEIILPLAKLTAVLRESVDEELIIESADDGGIIFRGERSKWEVPTHRASDFPDVPDFDVDSFHEVKAGVLVDLIHKTTFAAAESSQVRFATSGILVEAVDGEVGMVATNGGMLVRMHGDGVPHQGHTTEKKTRIVPVKALQIIQKNLVEPDEAVRMALRDSDIMVKTERATIYSRLIEGRFPNYANHLPSKFKFSVELNAGSLLLAIRQAAIATNEESIRVTLTFSKNKLSIGAKSQAGVSQIEIPVSSAKDFSASFKPTDFIKWLSKVEPDAIVAFEGNDEKSAAKMTQGNYLLVAAPLFKTE